MTADAYLQEFDEYLKVVDKTSALAAAPVEAGKPAEVQAVIDYPWTTAEAADGSLIIGTRQQGRFGTRILTVSSLSKVLGSSSARAMIEDVCSRDNISPPWKAGNISEYHDPSRLEKDPVRRRHLQETQAASATDKHPEQRKQGMDEAMGKGQGALEPLKARVQGLEKGMEEMKNMVAILNDNMEALMKMLKESSLEAK
ncbi:hypothetical protein K4K55_012789 [Colletotrichum sp. SAR 10_96]|nr:hypothetical protein K4K55_012789 [Colletotrichum sp. SAR 10_96]